LVLVSGCALDGGEPELGDRFQGIVGGQSHTGDPAVALLDLGQGLCTGTVISPKIILTAAHCLSGPATSITANFINTIGETGEVIGAVSYDIKANTDIGAIALERPASMPPIPANPHPLEDALGAPVRIVGFGVTSENGADSGVKRLGTATLDSVPPGGEMYTTNDPQGTCYGDSGGPNFMSFDGVEYVAGVTSRGTSICGDGLDIAVRADSHIEWIDAFIDANDPGECTADGRCVQGCATIDPDCCVTDGACVEECGSSDPECGPGDGDPFDPETAGDNIQGACSAAGPGGAAGLVPALLALLALAALRRRRRTSLIMFTAFTTGSRFPRFARGQSPEQALEARELELL
jgi:MYXO-CTERM domain-containing protein